MTPAALFDIRERFSININVSRYPKDILQFDSRKVQSRKTKKKRKEKCFKTI